MHCNFSIPIRTWTYGWARDATNDGGRMNVNIVVFKRTQEEKGQKIDLSGTFEQWNPTAHKDWSGYYATPGTWPNKCRKWATTILFSLVQFVLKRRRNVMPHSVGSFSFSIKSMSEREKWPIVVVLELKLNSEKITATTTTSSSQKWTKYDSAQGFFIVIMLQRTLRWLAHTHSRTEHSQNKTNREKENEIEIIYSLISFKWFFCAHELKMNRKERKNVEKKMKWASECISQCPVSCECACLDCHLISTVAVNVFSQTTTTTSFVLFFLCCCSLFVWIIMISKTMC